jgi:hypothetical protein
VISHALSLSLTAQHLRWSPRRLHFSAASATAVSIDTSIRVSQTLRHDQRILLSCLLIAAAPPVSFAQTGFVDVIDHIHLAAPDQAKGVDWYHTHFGATPVNVDSTVTALKAKNIKVTTEPRPLVLPSGTAMRLAFIQGPGGVRIELVQRDNLKSGR